ncbi:aspartate kinase [Desulfocicer vacuolatum DSM 3385]|uniref:aspartate kinase n=1 Tax=Desulfocicer vacuolatum DSM 3385 TaxID=1121400 RepID=A0A1W2EJU8_9BACT|nr:aspartate kinase [Desulfocicer vacuolatum]SMD09772.1 aspartate kinase [Desulfocicer vacuolatum DSM 3385]
MAKHHLNIEKIGGTSMSRFSEIVDNIILKDKEHTFGRIYVVSAYAGVTNDLLEHKKTNQPGIYKLFEDQQNYPIKMIRLQKSLYKLNETFRDIGLDVEAANNFIGDRIDQAINILRSMDNVLASGYVSRKELLLAAMELLASLGEMHSAFNSANILKNRGYNTTFVDLSGWDDSRQLTIDERIKDSFAQINPFSTICFSTGYTKGTEGIMREFDRGYSEVTFSKIAVLLGADEAVIHKEYHLCSGDPLIIGEKNVKPVCNTNYDVADQLADVGMEAIHPKASKPLEIKNIPIRVKNAFDPDHPGTLITKDFIAPESKVEIITGSNEVICMEIHDTRMVGEVGFDLRIMQIFDKFHVSYISKMTNANTIDLIIEEKDCTPHFLAELNEAMEEVSTSPVAIVCAIGSNIGQPGIMAKAAQALAGKSINILAVSQTNRQTNMQFIVERDQFSQAQVALHGTLCA